MTKNLLFLLGTVLSFSQAVCQLPNCPQQASQIPNFTGIPDQVSPANLGQVITNDGLYTVGEVFRYTNAVTSPANINAYIYIEAAQNATVQVLDNNSLGIASRFQPTIRPNPVNLTAAVQEGWIQFRIEFRYNGGSRNGQLVNLAAGLQFRHFDIDGYSHGSTGSFRETGWTTGQLGAYFIAPTDLTNGGITSDNGPPDPSNWIKILGQAGEHDGPSSDPNVAYTSQFGTVNTIRFRMGYVFEKGDGGNVNNQVAREYAAEFGCFDLSNNIPLPVKLESFNGVYRNEKVLLNWITSTEVGFSRFEVERSVNGADFSTAGIVLSKGNPGTESSYEFPDDPAAANSSIVYYRLKMVDNDDQFSFSPIVVIRRENSTASGLTVFPNPSRTNNIQVRLFATVHGPVEISVIGLDGKQLAKQRLSAGEGTNSIPLRLPALQPGVYVLQVKSRDKTESTRFTLLR